MNNSSPSTDRIELMRRDTIILLYKLTSEADKFELPKPLPALAEQRDKLEENHYKVLVMGEAKRGKSTFVNALIGQDILPTGMSITTSQLFHVSHAEQEAYRFRFEDGSTEEITRDKLPRYGSQVVADVRRDRIIRRIEVEVPIKYLPKEVSILDTPGLGSLYAAHAQITLRFVPDADAVIYVLDSDRPMGESDIEYIEKILDVTPHIFFIQTKIDRYGREHWQDIQKRNKDILIGRFSDRLTDTRIWPISSKHLMTFAQRGAKRYQRVSRHPEMSTALEAFLSRVTSWGRTGKAIVLAEDYYIHSRQTLTERLANLREQSEQKRAERREAMALRQQQFEAQWGKGGTKGQQLRENIKEIATGDRRKLEQALQSGCDIEREQQSQIDALHSVDEAIAFGERMSGEIRGAALEKWDEVHKDTQESTIRMLAPFVEAAESLNLPLEASAPDIQPSPMRPIKDDLLDKIWASGLNALGYGLTVGGGLIGVIAAVSTTPLPLGVVSLLALPTVVGFVDRWRSSEQTQLKEAQQQLRTHLSTVLQDVRNHWFNVKSGHLSLVDKEFKHLQRVACEQIQAIVDQKSSEVEAELARLADEAQLDDKQRKHKGQLTQQELAEWDQIGHTIQKMLAQLEKLDQ